MIKYLIIFLLISEIGVAQLRPSNISVNAKNSIRDTQNDTIILEDDVQVIYGDYHLSAKSAVVHLRSKSIDARGDVLVVTPKATIGGERVILSWEDNTGLIYDGYVQSGNVIFEGILIQKINETDYLAEQARYTTCINCPETWSFSGSRIKASLGGYAKIKNTVLRVGILPVVWLPYLVVPLRSHRQTGLLPPDFSKSDRGGLEISESIFWAISNSQDATFTFHNYEFLGLKGALNYRYLLSEKSGGELDSAMLNDRAASTENRFSLFQPRQGALARWFIKYKHYYELPNDFVQRTEINNASDLQYPKDFPLETKNNGDPAMENRISIVQRKPKSLWMIDSSYYVHLLQANPLANNDFSVHRVPEIRYSRALSPIGQSRFLYELDANYVNFTRSGLPYDTFNSPYSSNNRHLETGNATTGDICNSPKWSNDPSCRYQASDTFNPNRDIIRTGQRIDANVTLMRPFNIGGLWDFLPKLSLRQTEYFFSLKDHPRNTRSYLRADVTNRVTFSRVMKQSDEISYKHEIQPELTATMIPTISHPSHPFFGGVSQDSIPYFTNDKISDQDLFSPYGLQFDYNDRLYDKKLLSLFVTNKLIRKSVNNYDQVLTWRLGQSYNAAQAENGVPYDQALSDVVSDLSVNFNEWQVYQRANYYPTQQILNSSSRIRYTTPWSDFLELTYREEFNTPPGQPATLNSREYMITAKKSLKWIDIVGRAVLDPNPPTDRTSDPVKTYIYGAQLRLPGECWYIRMLNYRENWGGSVFKVQFDFAWDGQRKPGMSESALEQF